MMGVVGELGEGGMVMRNEGEVVGELDGEEG